VRPELGGGARRSSSTAIPTDARQTKDSEKGRPGSVTDGRLAAMPFGRTPERHAPRYIAHTYKHRGAPERPSRFGVAPTGASGIPRRPRARSVPLPSGGADAQLLSELRRESVDVHLEVLVLGPRSDRTFNNFAYGLDGFAFPDANAELVIVGSCMDR